MPNARVPAAATGLPVSSLSFPPAADRTPSPHMTASAADARRPMPSPRTSLAAAIEAAIALLDAWEPDPDLEDTHDHEADTADDEPSLGSPSAGGSGWGESASQENWAASNRDGFLEEGEPDVDGEPSLGVPEDHPSVRGSGYTSAGDQTSWGSAGNDRDLEDEHDGKEPDADGEPSYGSTSTINQEHAWAPTDTFWGSGEGEPSLAFTSIPAILPRGYDSDREYDAADAPHDAEDDCDATELSGDWHEVFAPCLDQRAERDVHCEIAHHPRALRAIAREQRAMQRCATKLRRTVVRLRKSGEGR